MNHYIHFIKYVTILMRTCKWDSKLILLTSCIVLITVYYTVHVLYQQEWIYNVYYNVILAIFSISTDVRCWTQEQGEWDTIFSWKPHHVFNW